MYIWIIGDCTLTRKASRDRLTAGYNPPGETFPPPETTQGNINPITLTRP